MKTLAAVLFIVLVLSSPLFALRKVYLNGVDGYTGCEDTYMIEYRVEANYGDAIYIECQSEDGRQGGSRMKPLIRFNHLGLAGHTVNACTLELYCYVSIGEYQTIQLHEVLRNWSEFQTTCLTYKTDSAWTDFACGCNDEDASSSYVCSMVDSGGVGWKAFPLPTALVQRWVDAPGDTNDGLLVWAPEDQPGEIKDRSFRSSDMFASSLRPRLIVHYDDSCGGLSQWPVLLDIADVGGDAGGMVELTWKRSAYDVAGSDPSIKRYKVWRRRSIHFPPLLGLGPEGKPVRSGGIEASEAGLAWELVGRVRATGDCYYSFSAPTYCDSSGAGSCLISFYVSAHTRAFGEHFDSPAAEGYSVNNLALEHDGSAEADDNETQHHGEMTSTTYLEIVGPNPGSEVFDMRFGLARSDWVRLRIYDVRGRVVETLLDDLRPSGPHRVTWDCAKGGDSELPPGVYIVNLLTSTENCSQKLVLLK